MGRKKNKWFKKVINFYRYIFKFEVPYNILIDGNFVAVMMQKKLEMKEHLSKVLDDNVHLVIPSCIVHELREINNKLPGIIDIVMRYKIEECNHGEQILSPENCIKSYIGKRNHKKYFVATQDSFLRTQLRKTAGVPLLFFGQNMILVDKPSKASMEASERVIVFNIERNT
jgi:U3 small nucleolar RNA-associated protein 23